MVINDSEKIKYVTSTKVFSWKKNKWRSAVQTIISVIRYGQNSFYTKSTTGMIERVRANIVGIIPTLFAAVGQTKVFSLCAVTSNIFRVEVEVNITAVQ